MLEVLGHVRSCMHEQLVCPACVGRPPFWRECHVSTPTFTHTMRPDGRITADGLDTGCCAVVCLAQWHAMYLTRLLHGPCGLSAAACVHLQLSVGSSFAARVFSCLSPIPGTWYVASASCTHGCACLVEAAAPTHCSALSALCAVSSLCGRSASWCCAGTCCAWGASLRHPAKVKRAMVKHGSYGCAELQAPSL